MVSFLSFFSKKKQRNPPSPPASNPDQPIASSTRPKPAQRFLSLRSRKKPRPYDISARRTSSELQRRRSNRQSAGRNGDAPRLDLAFEVRAGEGRDGDELGFEAKKKMTEKEVNLIRTTRFTLDEVEKGWKWFGGALRRSGIEEPGIMLPHQSVDPSAIDQLLVLFILSIRSELVSSFPTFVQDTNTGDSVHQERLDIAIREVSKPEVIAEVLKIILRRLDASTSSTTSTAHILDVELYTKFVQAERAARYPKDAYTTLLLPRLRTGEGAYLEEVFEVWSAIAARCEVNNMTGGKLCLLLGWWLWGCGTSIVSSWKELYDGWYKAGARVEHLFLAWLRDQSTRQKLPIKLLHLVDAYPFEESAVDDTAFPPPPPSSFARSTLHITLSSTVASKGRYHPGPREILLEAKRASSEGKSSLWDDLQSAHRGSSGSMLGEASQTFLDRLPGAKPEERLDSGRLSTPINPDQGPTYRPFAATRTPSAEGSRLHPLRSPSYGEAGSPVDSGAVSSPLNLSQAASPHSTVFTPGNDSALKSPASPALWEDFEKIGFADSPEPVSLALSPSTTSIPLSPGTPTAGITFGQIPKPRKSSDKNPLATYKLTREEVIDVNDVFMAFTEDGQMDPSSTTSWPPYALLRLATPVDHPAAAKSIEWLLITLEFTSPSPAPDSISNRPTSPGADSTTSRMSTNFGLSNFANTFRRSSSYGTVRLGGGLRKSIFGGSAKSLSKTGGLASLTENSSHTQHAAPSSLQGVTEMGQISTHSQGSSYGTADGIDTKPEEWIYKAEGGAHLIFTYTGTSRVYRGKVLRIRKASPNGSNLENGYLLQREWRENLIPKLLPETVLLSCKEISLPSRWAQVLFDRTQVDRPQTRKRKDEGSQRASESVKAYLMDDLLYSDGKEGEVTLCVEIKPKWGFLPSAENLRPPESVPIKTRNCRYCMHQYLRDPPASKISRFCPLDLYSGEEHRMEKAVRGLWETWERTNGAGNNWRVYVDGKPILPDQENAQGLTREMLEQLTLTSTLPALRHTEILGNIKQLQSSLDPMDISALAEQFVLDYPNTPVFDPSMVESPSPAELAGVVALYQAGIPCGEWTLRQRLVAHSLSAVFKDCSIFVMTTITRDETGTWNNIAGPAHARVKIIDLDLKPMSSLQHWYDLDTKIWTNWRDGHQAQTSNTLGGLGVPDDQSTRAIFLPSGRATPNSETAASTNQPSINAQDIGGSALGRSLGSKRSRKTSDGLSLGGALAISPTKSHFDTDRRPSVSAVLSDEVELEDEGIGGGPTPIKENPESPTAARNSRSLAPSPSPHVDSRDLAGDEEVSGGILASSQQIPTTDHGEADHLHSHSTAYAATENPSAGQDLSHQTVDLHGAGTSAASVDRATIDIPPDSAVPREGAGRLTMPSAHDEEQAPVIRSDDALVPGTQLTDIYGTARSAQRSSGQFFGGDTNEATDAEVGPGLLGVDAETSVIPRSPTTFNNPFSLGPPIAASDTKHSGSTSSHANHTTPKRTLDDISTAKYLDRAASPDEKGLSAIHADDTPIFDATRDSGTGTIAPDSPSGVSFVTERPFETAQSDIMAGEHNPYFGRSGGDLSTQGQSIEVHDDLIPKAEVESDIPNIGDIQNQHH